MLKPRPRMKAMVQKVPAPAIESPKPATNPVTNKSGSCQDSNIPAMLGRGRFKNKHETATCGLGFSWSHSGCCNRSLALVLPLGYDEDAMNLVDCWVLR